MAVGVKNRGNVAGIKCWNYNFGAVVNIC